MKNRPNHKSNQPRRGPKHQDAARPKRAGKPGRFAQTQHGQKSRPQNSRPHPSTRHSTSPQHRHESSHGGAQHGPLTNLPNGRAVIGLHSAREALKIRAHAVREVWLKEGAERIPDLSTFADWATAHGRPVHFKNENHMNRLAPSHQGVCLWVTETPTLNLEELSADSTKPMVFLALDEISDPHNVGALLRTAWLFDAKGVIVPDHRSAHLTPSVIKVASGGAEHVPLLVTNRLSDELSTLKEKGFWIYGLAGEGQQTLPQTKFHEKVVLVVGSEDKGLRSTTRNVCDELIRIPQLDPDASFNASVAGSIALYEVQRQRLNPLK